MATFLSERHMQGVLMGVMLYDASMDWVLTGARDGVEGTRVATAAVSHYRWAYTEPTVARAVTMGTFVITSFIALSQLRQLLRTEPSISRRLFAMLSLFTTVASVALIFSNCVPSQFDATATSDARRAKALLLRAARSRWPAILSCLVALAASALARPAPAGHAALELASAVGSVAFSLSGRALLYLVPAAAARTSGRGAKRAFQAAMTSVTHGLGPLDAATGPALAALAALLAALALARIGPRPLHLRAAAAATVCAAALFYGARVVQAPLVDAIAGNGMSTALRPTSERLGALTLLAAVHCVALLSGAILALAGGRGAAFRSLRELADAAERSPWRQVGMVDPVNLAKAAALQGQAVLQAAPADTAPAPAPAQGATEEEAGSTVRRRGHRQS